MTTMSRINNINELRAEIARVKLQVREQEELIKADIKNIGEGLKPANLLLNAVESATGINLDKKEFLKEGIGYAVSLLIQRYVLKTEKKLEHKIYEWIDALFIRIKHFLSRIIETEAKREEREEESEENSTR